MKERYKNNRVVIPVLVIGILLMVYLLLKCDSFINKFRLKVTGMGV